MLIYLGYDNITTYNNGSEVDKEISRIQDIDNGILFMVLHKPIMDVKQV